MSELSSVEKAEFWRLAVGEQSVSGLSARAFCRREGLSIPSFYAWRRKLGLTSHSADPQPHNLASKRAKLVPVKLIQQSLAESSTTRDIRRSQSAMQSSSRQGAISAPASSCDQRRDDIEIATPGGFTVRLSQSVEAGWLSMILTTLLEVEQGVKRC
jgi:hypothetical protein